MRVTYSLPLGAQLTIADCFSRDRLQGAQFALSRRAIRSRPRSFYRALLDELVHIDPVASYYLELMWWQIFDARTQRACVPLSL